MCYFVQWKKERKQEDEYRRYMADALYVVAENTRSLGGMYMRNRYGEKPPEPPKETGQATADRIIKGLIA